MYQPCTNSGLDFKGPSLSEVFLSSSEKHDDIRQSLLTNIYISFYSAVSSFFLRLNFQRGKHRAVGQRRKGVN